MDLALRLFYDPFGIDSKRRVKIIVSSAICRCMNTSRQPVDHPSISIYHPSIIHPSIHQSTHPFHTTQKTWWEVWQWPQEVGSLLWKCNISLSVVWWPGSWAIPPLSQNHIDTTYYDTDYVSGYYGSFWCTKLKWQLSLVSKISGCNF